MIVCGVLVIVLVEFVFVVILVEVKYFFDIWICDCKDWVVRLFVIVVGMMFGLIGFGVIGEVFVLCVQVLGMWVLVMCCFDLLFVVGVECVDFVMIFVQVDYIVFVVLVIVQIEWMVDVKFLLFVKLNLYLINIVCGILIDDDVLFVVFDEGWVGCVMFDVMYLELLIVGYCFYMYFCVCLLLYISVYMIEMWCNFLLSFVVNFDCFCCG